MKIALIQTEIVWGSPEANISVMDGLIDHAGKADLYVLPEMFSTGFVMRPEKYAETKGLSLRWMQEKAYQKDAAVCGSLAVADGENYYNRFYFVKPDGSTAIYDLRTELPHPAMMKNHEIMAKWSNKGYNNQPARRPRRKP